MLGVERFLLADEQSLVPRSWQVFVDRSEHDGFSADPPSTALNSERWIVATKCAVISPNAIPDWPLLAAKRSFGNTNVEMIVLYQAALAVDMARDTTQLTHHFVPVLGPKYAAWRDGGSPRLQHQFADRKDRDERYAADHDERVTIMPMPAGYMFQRSEIYRYYDPQKGEHNGVISNPAPGVFINAVSRPGPALTMMASPDSRLLLLP